MVCALTVRELHAGTFEDFREAFMTPVRAGQMPEGWRRFDMLQSVDDPAQVICFGIFDGTAAQLRESAALVGYEEQQAAIAPFVDSVGTDGLFEIVEDIVNDG